MIYNKKNLVLYRKNGFYLLIENYNKNAFEINNNIDVIMQGV